MKEINELLNEYKERIGKDYLSEVDKGLVTTYLDEFAKDLINVFDNLIDHADNLRKAQKEEV